MFFRYKNFMKFPDRELRKIKKYAKFRIRKSLFSIKKKLRSPFNYLRVKFESRFMPNPYVQQFDALKCAEDLEEIMTFNSKHKCNIMALWKTYKRYSGIYKDKISDDTVKVFTNNNRVALFLKYMTKWTIIRDGLKDGLLVNCAFIINPDKKEARHILENLDATDIVLISNLKCVNDFQKFELAYTYASEVIAHKKKDVNIIGPNNEVLYMNFVYRNGEDRD